MRSRDGTRALLFDESSIKLGVGAVHRDKLGVLAPFDDVPFIEHQHLIGVANRAEPMGDHEARAALEQ